MFSQGHNKIRLILTKQIRERELSSASGFYFRLNSIRSDCGVDRKFQFDPKDNSALFQ